MAGNSIGKLFTLTSFGESHGPAIGGVIDGCPAGIRINTDLIRHDMQRRRPGQSAVTSARAETDEFEILSGISGNMTTGAPIAFIIRNKDARPSDYKSSENIFRPSHADFTYYAKYGVSPATGGGRSSARETAVRVFAGAIAKQLLSSLSNVSIVAFVSQIGHLKANVISLLPEAIEASVVRCPDKETSALMEKHLKMLKEKGDTTGGVIQCHINDVPPGLGEPVYDKLHADLGKAMLGINAVHGFEYGSGFAGAAMTGSEHNDVFINEDGGVKTKTNHSGGIQGGISNGMEIYFRVAFKPVSTIRQKQSSVDINGRPAEYLLEGRHDPCVVPRAVPVVEAMAAIVLADHFLLNQSSALKNLSTHHQKENTKSL